MSDEPLFHFFNFEQLRDDLRPVTVPYVAAAHAAIATLPRNDERTVVLRLLLQAADSAVRAHLRGV